LRVKAGFSFRVGRRVAKWASPPSRELPTVLCLLPAAHAVEVLGGAEEGSAIDEHRRRKCPFVDAVLLDQLRLVAELEDERYPILARALEVTVGHDG
jgi:hypothetical protein